MFRSALLILSGNAFGSAMTFLRNLLVARLVSVEDYGIAATFAISMAIVELTSSFGLQQLIVQDKDGNDTKLQSGLQGFHAVRAVFSAALLFFLAHPIANFLGIPEVAWAYQVLAIVPLLNGFIHFDVYRLQRQQKFGPLILSTSLPAFLSVVLTWPLFQYFGDYRVMLYAVIAQGVATVFFSHLVSIRPYSLRLDRQLVGRAFHFGWPLLINNILLILVLQGEKLVVGRELGMAELAIFAMGFTLTLTPTLIVAKSTQSFFLPQLSAAKGDQERFEQLAYATMQTSLTNGLFLMAGIVVFGAVFVHFVLGDKYAALVPYLIPLALLHALRVFKTGSAVVALAKGRTSNAMIANMFRVMSLPVSWYAAVHGYGLFVIILIASTGELLGFIASLRLVQTRVNLSLGPMGIPVLIAFVLLALAMTKQIWFSGLDLLLTTVVTATLMAVALFVMKNLRRYVSQRVFTQYAE
ncbi:oligosaccharide flippase family protein [Ruegeria sp. HKCCA5014]|uniref:oligosaccharide flippase family protein n=1 Tax=Ruegeria sp. HKCCA5014 TaxID=2682980 RepID=UPI0014894930|nr:oligosaccharide flippase family protein [Ruegeria sp. HKCCA5014]